MFLILSFVSAFCLSSSNVCLEIDQRFEIDGISYWNELGRWGFQLSRHPKWQGSTALLLVPQAKSCKLNDIQLNIFFPVVFLQGSLIANLILGVIILKKR